MVLPKYPQLILDIRGIESDTYALLKAFKEVLNNADPKLDAAEVRTTLIEATSLDLTHLLTTIHKTVTVIEGDTI